MSPEQRESLRESVRLLARSNDIWREQLEEALPLAKRAMAIRDGLLGKESRDYIESLILVAKIRKNLEEFPRARVLYEEALNLRRKILGTNHPDYLKSLRDLSGFDYRIGESDKADVLQEKATGTTLIESREGDR